MVLDLSMGDLGGFDVLEALNQDPETTGINVIVHTSKVLDDADYTRLSRAVDVIPKSIMTSREAAEVRFSEAFRKVGLSYTRRGTIQQVAAE
jgi:CheY-like chemotaxis protein